ncbi:PKD domain-containing protein [bacterium]|nr:MAG: PKD domain-containing protein [bacterium]
MKKIVLLFVLIILFEQILFAQTKIPGEYIVRTFIDEDGNSIDEIIVPGRPPADHREPAVELPDPSLSDAINILSNVPAFDWSYGCSATSGAMISGYYDNGSYPNMYTGPTNGGVVPMDNSIWGSGECPLSATHQGYDGLTVRGHVDDYWSYYGSTVDPYYGNWTEHGYADCTADYMGTNQYINWQNTDGSTTFYNYTNGAPLYDYTSCEPGHKDGCHGLREFFESRGYSIQANGNYSQYIYGYNGNTQGFTFNQFKAEIDAGRTVMIQVAGHSMVGFGYDDSTNLVYLHDTWDYSNHTMTWGGSYSGMQHYGVSVFILEPVTPTPVADFVGNPTSGEAPLTVWFTDQSSGIIDSWSWSFPEGSPSLASGQGPHQVIYNNQGNYDVSLTVSGPGGSDAETKYDYITVTAPPPIADFVGNPTSGQAPLTVWFTDQSSGIIDSWYWSFPGGSPSSTSGQGPHQVVYNNPDSYDVSLTVSGPGGSDTEMKYNYITVTAPQPIADFVGNPTSGQAPLTVWFTDQSSGIIDSWSWSFPGGSPSSASGQGPHQVIYNNPDSYDVSLTVSGPGGSDTEMKYNYITVSNPNFPPPENLVAEDDSNGYVPLNWDPPSLKDPILEGYKIYRSLTSGSGYNQTHQIYDPYNTNYEDSNVINGTTYYYVVTATYSNPTGESIYSIEANGTPQGRYSIAGYVLDSYNDPIEDVMLTLSGYISDAKYTNSYGYYIFNNLVGGKFYSLTPSKSGWTFDPVSIEFDPLENNQYNQDFVGTSDVTFYNIAGYVSYCISGLPVGDVVLDISGDISDIEITNSSGYYSFSDLPEGGNYLIVPGKEDDISVNCISAMDAAWVLKYSIGLIEFLECQIAAGDVTGDGTVSSFDAAKILKYSIGLIEEFPVGKDWCFLPENRYYQDLQQDFLYENYIGVVYGDVTHNWTPSVLIMKDGDTDRILSLNSVTGGPGEVVNVPVNLQNSEDAISARIMLTYDATLVTFQEVNLTSLTEGFLIDSNNLSGEVIIGFAGLYPIEEGGDILELSFEINESAQVGNKTLLQFGEVWINETETPTTIDGEIVISSNLDISDGSLTSCIWNCYPNPFEKTNIIEFQLSKETHVEIRVFNVQGQLVEILLNDKMNEGKHQFSWDASNMVSGLYFYQITAGNRVFTKKVLLFK